MRTLNHSLSILVVTICLLIGQSGAFAAPAQIQLPPNFNKQTTPTVRVASDAKDLEEAFDLAFQIMQRKDLYRFMNEKLRSIVTPIGNSRNQGLSMSQIVYLLMSEKKMWSSLREFVQGPDLESMNALTAKQKQDVFQSLFDKVFYDTQKLTELLDTNEGSRPLRLQSSTGNAGYSKMRMYVNHPVLTNPEDPKSSLEPATDLRRLVVDFIRGAKHEVMFNVFELSLDQVADALIEQGAKGVKIHGGVDYRESYLKNSAVKTVVDRLRTHESATFKMSLVNSTGLNHQKMIVRDAGTPDAAVLLLSGNFTQSCLGPEGDAVDLPPEKRPSSSLPNANHAVLINGVIPAAVVKQELNKVLIAEARGRAEYPLGGAYQIMGPRKKGLDQSDRDWIILAFSPNGGLGNVNRDVLSRAILETKGPIEVVQFAFSSDILVDSILHRASAEIEKRRSEGLSTAGVFQGVGETSFALRTESALLKLSGLSQDRETKVYSEISPFLLKDQLSQEEWLQWRSQIRTAPSIYGERHTIVDGKSVKTTVKIHHKVFVFPESHTAVVGTSFNASASAETNNEQVLIVHNNAITHKAHRMFRTIYSKGRQSVAAAAKARNGRIERTTPTDREDGIEAEAM